MTHLDRHVDEEVVRLTPRQLQVARCIVLGYSNRETASLLEIETGTVKHFLGQIFDKVGVDSRRSLLDFVMSGHLDLIEHGETRRNVSPHPADCVCLYHSTMRVAQIN